MQKKNNENLTLKQITAYLNCGRIKKTNLSAKNMRKTAALIKFCRFIALFPFSHKRFVA